MFSHMLYFYKERILEYKSIVTGQNPLQLDEVSITSENNGQIGTKYFNGNKKSTENYKGKVLNNPSIDYNDFIKSIENNDFFIDLINQNNNYDISCIGKNSIIQFESTIKIPSQFDIIKIIEKINIKGELAKEDMYIYENFLEIENAKIPIIVKINENIATSKLISSNFICEYQELEELENEDVVILAKVISSKCSCNKSIFNPLTDFMKINRVLRRSLMSTKDIPEELEEIFIEQDYINLEVLAIYQ